MIQKAAEVKYFCTECHRNVDYNTGECICIIEEGWKSIYISLMSLKFATDASYILSETLCENSWLDI